MLSTADRKTRFHARSRYTPALVRFVTGHACASVAAQGLEKGIAEIDLAGVAHRRRKTALVRKCEIVGYRKLRGQTGFNVEGQENCRQGGRHGQAQERKTKK